MDTQEIVKLAAEHGLVLQDNIQLNEMGADFRVAYASDLSGQKWILRIPRRTDLAEQIEKEKNILALVKDRLSVAVPDWQIVTPRLVAYPMLENSPVLTYDPQTYEVTWYVDRNSKEYIPTLASTLVQLHEIPEQAAAAHGIKITTPETIRQEIQDKLEKVKNALPLSAQLEERWRSWLNNDRLWPDFTCFIHGDLFAGHILAKSDGQITGIIDWSEGQMGDPAVDFSGHLAAFGEESLRELIACYEKAGGKVWDSLFAQVVERHAASPLFYAYFAIKTQSPEHIEAAKAQLNPVA